MNKSFLIDIVEALYQIRCARTQKVSPLVKMHLEFAEGPLVRSLEEVGLTIGKTAAEADQAKRFVMDAKDENAVDKVLEVRIREEVKVPFPVDTVQQALEDASRISGSDSVQRELGRFTQFCSRSIYAKPDGPLIEDDPEIPVYSWIRERCRNGVPFEDVSAMANLYVDWTKEVCNAFKLKTGI